MPMKNPPHPGGFVLRQCIQPLGLSITDAAALGVTRTTLSELVNERRGISPEMAVRLSKVFGGLQDAPRRVPAVFGRAAAAVPGSAKPRCRDCGQAAPRARRYGGATCALKVWPRGERI